MLKINYKNTRKTVDLEEENNNGIIRSIIRTIIISKENS